MISSLDRQQSHTAASHEIKPVATDPEHVKPVHEHVEGDALLVDKHGHIRLLPIPSSNPNDPLNFKPWEKAVIIFCCSWFSLLSLALAGGLGPILGVFFEMYIPQGYDQNHITFLLTIPSLAIGLGNYIILPLSLAVGRRPVFLISTAVLLAAIIGSAVQDSYTGHLTSRVIQGLATGASESLLPLILTEVTFLHQRGRVFGFYWMVQSIFSGLLNLVSSYINADLGWRWYYWVFTIAISVGFIIAIFCAFETRFSRPAASIDGVVVITDDYGVTHVLPDDQAQDYLDQVGAPAPDNAEDTNVPRKSYLGKLKPWSKPHPQPFRMILLSWARMLQCLTSPAIIYTVLISSITLGCVVDISLSYDAVLQGYGWPAKNIGLINLGAVVGAILGALYATVLGDPFVLWMARRNHGIHKPEHRLIVLAPPALLGFSMLLVYGYTAGGTATWWGPVLAYTFYSATWVAVLVISTTFASEACPKHPGPALVVVVGTKNIVSFGFTYGFTPLMDKGGYTYAFGVLAGVFGACFILGVPIYILNPKWRQYIARMEQRWGVNSTD